MKKAAPKKLPEVYFLNSDVVFLAKDLIGKVLFTKFSGVVTAGIIVETEAYNGVVDKASHAYGNRRTRRTETMYQRGGISYVYLCYGIHHLFNIVSNSEDVPHAVLIRGLKPIIGIETMQTRRQNVPLSKLCAGPGTLSQAMGIKTEHDGTSLSGHTIWIEEHGFAAEKKATPRIGIDYAGEDALLPYRFIVKDQSVFV